MNIRTSRRAFLSGGAGLVLALTLPVPGARVLAQEAAAPAAPAPIPPNAFIRIAADDTVTIIVKHIEFGQGPLTGLATLAAEELDADWSQIRGELAPANAAWYGNAVLGGLQGTGGSTALPSSFMIMRQAGASVRAMLVQAAAAEWGVPAEEITVAKGRISHAASGNESGFGAFAEAAAALTPPADPVLKTPDQWVLIGTDLHKLDTDQKTDGQAIFTLDQYPDGVQTVVVAHPPAFGATVASVDDGAALAVPGVLAVRQIPQGVAVYASNTFAALKGRAALIVEWDETNAETRDDAALSAMTAEAARKDGLTVEEEGGDLAAALAAEGATLHEAEFHFPFLAHAPLETLDGLLTAGGGKAHASYGSQFPTFDHQTIAQVLGLEPVDVTLDVMLAGGSFGRRAQADSHLAAELAEIAKAGGDGTYKLMWTREDDLKGGYYRPMSAHRFRAALDADGKITAWENVVATQSLLAGTPMEPFLQGGPDATAFEGSVTLPYDLGARRIGWEQTTTGVPVLWWRSVGSTHTAFAVEIFLDELLAAAGKDPVQGRLDLLKPDDPRPRAVIEKVAQMANWQGPQGADGKAYGMAYAKSFGTYVAQIVEVEDRGGAPHVTRVWCAVDCGVPVNPNIIKAQMEGGVGFGLCAALFNQITLGQGGRVQESNYDSYRMLRIGEMPDVQVEIIPSTADPTGVGEPGVPPIGPAVANAWRVLTGQPVRRLPMLQQGTV
ncbi:xanthine dehydrogenase family protein molybdopterin-binding subunit [Paracoccus sp. M683]|uniref:xanthine dehydrogenase family protein molybdopterin-binding subunit n=1 Tax=Paracoccus sp. M683 TaxID=2594268 RepID=UPI00117F3B79|nr:xanthine dehydrogenase family protein molybdopterin-binding subunit [Paracoccus sp. M683]TRW99434.1 xanthine dehydrogenase family protein molybdopterin-binding subunit [Paracoccus sp. M683]